MAQIKNVLFGKLAVSTRFITEEQLQECLDFQKEIEERGEKPPRLGEILEQKGYLTKQQIQSILETMSSMQRRRFGEIGVAFHFITLEQLETCLDIQKLLQAPQETVPLFGQALVAYRSVDGVGAGLLVSYAHAAEDVLSRWRRAMPYWVATALMFMAALLSGAWYIDRSMRAAARDRAGQTSDPT